MSPNKILSLLLLVAITAPSVSCIGPCKRLFKRGAPCGTTVQQPAAMTSPVAVVAPVAAAPVAAGPMVAAPAAVAPMVAAPPMVVAPPMVAVPTAPMAGYYCCPPPTVCCPPPTVCCPPTCCPQYGYSSESCGPWDSGFSSGCNDCGTASGYYEQGTYADPNAAIVIPPEGAIQQGPGFVPQTTPQGQGLTPQSVAPQAPITSGSGARYPAPQPESGN